jgi:hypothetical protein
LDSGQHRPIRTAVNLLRAFSWVNTDQTVSGKRKCRVRPPVLKQHTVIGYMGRGVRTPDILDDTDQSYTVTALTTGRGSAAATEHDAGPTKSRSERCTVVVPEYWH